MTTVATRPPRPIPTVQANPALLREGDMIYPDGPWLDATARPGPLWVVGCRTITLPVSGARAWWIDLEDRLVYLVLGDAKIRTQRRPNHQLLDPAVADRLAENYQEPRYG